MKLSELSLADVIALYTFIQNRIKIVKAIYNLDDKRTLNLLYRSTLLLYEEIQRRTNDIEEFNSIEL